MSIERLPDDGEVQRWKCARCGATVNCVTQVRPVLWNHVCATWEPATSGAPTQTEQGPPFSGYGFGQEWRSPTGRPWWWDGTHWRMGEVPSEVRNWSNRWT